MARPAIECVELAPYKLFKSFKSYFCQNGHPMALLGGVRWSCGLTSTSSSDPGETISKGSAL
jgi:hypothetical protein